MVWWCDEVGAWWKLSQSDPQLVVVGDDSLHAPLVGHEASVREGTVSKLSVNSDQISSAIQFVWITMQAKEAHTTNIFIAHYL